MPASGTRVSLSPPMRSPRRVCSSLRVFFFQAEDGIRAGRVTGVQTCALPISSARNAINAALIAFLAEAFDVPRRNVEIGRASRRERGEVTAAFAACRLEKKIGKEM